MEIASGWPGGFHDVRGRVGGRSWYSWRREQSWDGEAYFRAPHEDEVARGEYYALTILRLVFPVPVSLLPAAPGVSHRHGEVEESARHAVAVLTGELNRVTGPVVEALELS